MVRGKALVCECGRTTRGHAAMAAHRRTCTGRGDRSAALEAAADRGAVLRAEQEIARPARGLNR